MKNFFSKPYRFAAVISIVLTCSLVFSVLDTFVIPKALAKVTTISDYTESVASDLKAYGITSSDIAGMTSSKIAALISSKASQQTSSNTSSSASTGDSNETTVSSSSTTVSQNQDTSTFPAEPVITDTSYKDENINIAITTHKKYNATLNKYTTFYVADIRVTDGSYLKTAFANDTYGRNIKQKTSEMASAHSAIFAINGDFYGFRDTGYVVRNGVLYRSTPDTSKEALVIDGNGDFSTVSEGKVSAQSLVSSGAQQVLSFGPPLIKNSKIAVNSKSEVAGNEFTENPRTAIGQISKLHYVIIVSDGRTEVSSGLSFLDLAEEFSSRGCTIAYNLDGGGSSTMYFNGKVINVPTNGISIQERLVSDIVYFGN